MSAAHVYPGAVAEVEHRGGIVTIDEGIISELCPNCGNDHLHQLCEPDEDSSGQWRGFGAKACCRCRHSEPSD